MTDTTTAQQNPAPQTYFHCAPIELSIGAVIHPGNWWRILNLYQHVNNQLDFKAIREAMLEMGRQIHAPNKPSRFNCVFTCPTLADAIAFRNKHQRTQLIYEVVKVDENPTIHLGDYELATANYPTTYFQALFDQPRDYWLVAPTANYEVLIGGAVKISSFPQVPPPP